MGSTCTCPVLSPHRRTSGVPSFYRRPLRATRNRTRPQLKPPRWMHPSRLPSPTVNRLPIAPSVKAHLQPSRTRYQHVRSGRTLSGCYWFAEQHRHCLSGAHLRTYHRHPAHPHSHCIHVAKSASSAGPNHRFVPQVQVPILHEHEYYKWKDAFRLALESEGISEAIDRQLPEDSRANRLAMDKFRRSVLNHLSAPLLRQKSTFEALNALDKVMIKNQDIMAKVIIADLKTKRIMAFDLDTDTKHLNYFMGKCHLLGELGRESDEQAQLDILADTLPLDHDNSMNKFGQDFRANGGGQKLVVEHLHQLQRRHRRECEAEPDDAGAALAAHRLLGRAPSGSGRFQK